MALYKVVPSHGHTEAECAAIEREMHRDSEWLAHNGLVLTFGSDFSYFKALNASLRQAGCPPLVPIYDPAYEPIDEHSGVWLVVLDGKGTVVAVGAARLREVSDLKASLNDGSFLMGGSIPEGASSSVSASGIDGVSGPIAFLGSMWVRSGEDRARTEGQDLSSMIVGAMVRRCWYMWSSTLVALMDDRHAARARRRYGFRAILGDVWYADPRRDGVNHRYALLAIWPDDVREHFLALGAPGQIAAEAAA
jgi:hypothetical protein